MTTPIISTLIDAILDSFHISRLAETCDTIKTGDPNQPVTSIVTTFMATHAVIEKAVRLGANFIITHEPTFYSHNDDTESLEHDPVYLAKRKLIDDNGIVIWRLHDHIHMRQPDGIILGIVRALGWEAYADPQMLTNCTLPPMTIAEIAAHLKTSLGAKHIRMVGNPNMICQRAALLVGAAPVHMHMEALMKHNIDTIICGELNEWEACEYIRDANQQGRSKAILAIGHAISEEPGMRWLAGWLQQMYPNLTITHVPAEDPFRIL